MNSLKRYMKETALERWLTTYLPISRLIVCTAIGLVSIPLPFLTNAIFGHASIITDICFLIFFLSPLFALVVILGCMGHIILNPSRDTYIRCLPLLFICLLPALTLLFLVMMVAGLSNLG